MDRWYSAFPALRRRAQTSGLLGFAGLPAGRIRGLGTSQSLVPLVSYQRPQFLTVAQSRVAMEAIRPVSVVRAFQAEQQASTMAS